MEFGPCDVFTVRGKNPSSTWAMAGEADGASLKMVVEERKTSLTSLKCVYLNCTDLPVLCFPFFGTATGIVVSLKE